MKSVVGGGFTGLATALNLAENGFDTILIEAHRIAWGASGRNGGFLGSGLNWSQVELEKQYGVEHAENLWTLCESAKREVLNRIEKHQIECDLKPGVIAAALNEKVAKQYQSQVCQLRKQYAYDSIHYLKRSEICGLLGTDLYCAGIYDKGAGHLHPLKYAVGLARAASNAGVRIYESSCVTDFTPHNQNVQIKLNTGGFVEAKNLVLACNAYIGKLSKRIQRLIFPLHSYMIATEPLEEEVAREINREDVAVFDSRFSLDYFRLSADRRMLFGGGESYLPTPVKDIIKLVRPRMLKVYPKLAGVQIDYAWSGQIAITVSRLPAVGRIAQNLYFAQGYSGHGVALSNIVGKAIAQAINGKPDPFSAFERIEHRAFPGGRYLRWPIHLTGMVYYLMRDKLSGL